MIGWTMMMFSTNLYQLYPTLIGYDISIRPISLYFVDEFQDTSPVQWKIISLLCGDRNL